MRLTVFIRKEGADYWSEIRELPGCFASGRTLNELRDALGEAVGLYLWDQPVEIDADQLSVGPVEVCVTAPGR